MGRHLLIFFFSYFVRVVVCGESLCFELKKDVV